MTLPEFADTFADIQLGVLKSEANALRTQHFLEYITASDRGLKHYRELGFIPVQGDPWSGAPLP